MPVFKEDCDSELPLPSPIEISADLFEDLHNHLKRTEFLVEDNAEDRKKIEKLTKNIEQAQEILAKAEDKREALLRKNTSLKVALEDARQRVALSVNYWKEFGFHVTKISKDEDDFEEYEYIYSKLGGDQPPATDEYIIRLKFHNKQLEIVSQNPDVLNSETLTALNEKLSANCLSNDFKTADYKSAMTLIRKTLTTTLSKTQQLTATN